MNENLSIEEIIAKIDNRINELERQSASKQPYTPPTHLKEIDELNSLIGLSEVKEEVIKLTNYLKFIQKVQNQIKREQINLNMIFKGNPGTGKTTVARIMANILYNLGYLSNNNIIETTPRDFIAGYIGQTGIKTRKLLEQYAGGLIFIDEAYGFVSKDDENNFSDEAITEIIKAMETKQTVFIFAGYNNEMDDFLNLNPGIKSRIGYNIDFVDYTEEELFQMFMKKITETGFHIEIEAEDQIKTIIKTKKAEKNFGNGRMIDNLYNKVIIEHANLNYGEEDMTKLLTITTTAIANINIKQKKERYFE